jgi:hypothetical protein
MPVPPLFRGNQDIDDESEESKSRKSKSKYNDQYQPISQRNMNLSEDEKVNFMDKIDEYGKLNVENRNDLNRRCILFLEFYQFIKKKICSELQKILEMIIGTACKWTLNSQ